MRLLKPLIVLALIALAVVMWQRHADTSPAAAPPTPIAQARLPITPPAQDSLPPEAHAMLARIARGGPFEHRQDGVVFGNYEGLLPQQPRGYYHEYTVETPGARTRGARRIITGGTPPAVWYYTGDHYRSFRRIEVNP
ncbi:MAG: ribonuclease domain-containing protein [Rhodanobacter sp.]